MKELSKIKVYNIRKYIESLDFEGAKRTTHFLDKLSILEGKKGVLVFMNEAVGWFKDNLQDNFTVGLIDIKEDEIFMKPQYQFNINLNDIVNNCEYEEMLITEFVEDYNRKRRIIENFDDILKAINKIGLKKGNYYTVSKVVDK
jgi:hypothetical protein